MSDTTPPPPPPSPPPPAQGRTEPPATEVASFRPRWGIGDVVVRPQQLVTAFLVPLVAAVAGEFGEVFLWLVWAVAAVAFLALVVDRRPSLIVGSGWVRLRGPGASSPTELLETKTVSRVVPLDLDLCAQVVASGRFDDEPVDTSPLLTVPVEPYGVDADAGRVAGLVVTTGRGKQRAHTLLPVWRPEEVSRLVRAITEDADGVELPGAAADLPEPPPSSWLPDVTVAMTRRGALAAVLVLPLVALVVTHGLSLVVRAVTLDPILGSAIGIVVVACFRLAELAASVAAIVTAAVAALAIVVWTARGEAIDVRAALRLGVLRAGWALWQLKVWLVGMAALIAGVGVAGRRIALAYGVVSLAIPGAQLVRELLRRTVEEARGPAPPLTRLSVTPQYIAVLAAAVSVWMFRIW